jgi:hypothetical protein
LWAVRLMRLAGSLVGLVRLGVCACPLRSLQQVATAAVRPPYPSKQPAPKAYLTL